MNKLLYVLVDLKNHMSLKGWGINIIIINLLCYVIIKLISYVNVFLKNKKNSWRFENSFQDYASSQQNLQINSCDQAVVSPILSDASVSNEIDEDVEVINSPRQRDMKSVLQQRENLLLSNNSSSEMIESAERYMSPVTDIYPTMTEENPRDSIADHGNDVTGFESATESTRTEISQTNSRVETFTIKYYYDGKFCSIWFL